MDKIARIRQEIERLKGICTAQIKVNSGQTFPFVMEMTGYDKLLSFLDTLWEEPDKSLEEEIGLWISENENIHHGDKLMVWLLKDVAHYFAEWQKNQMLKNNSVILSAEDFQALLDSHAKRVEQDYKEKMLKETVEGEIEEVSFNNGEEHNTIRFSFDEESLHVENRIWFPRSGKDGDKVRIVVLKAEEE